MSLLNAGTLRLDYAPDASDFGVISATVASAGFSGSTGSAVHAGQLQAFVDALAEFPLRQPACLYVGELEGEALIRITVSPSNGRGGLEVRVVLHDDRDRSRYLATRLYTVYPDMESFRLALAAAIQSGGEAVLTGDA